MKKNLFISIMLLFIPFTVEGQNNEKLEKIFVKAENALRSNNIDVAKKMLEEAAQKGHLPSTCLLGAISEGEYNYEIAIDYYKKAIDKNYEPAMVMLGRFFLDTHKGFPKNLDEARNLFLKLSDPAIDAVALREIADCYNYGYNGMEIDKEKAFGMYKKAADMGDGKAYIRLSDFYAKGIVVSRNLQQAQYLLIKANKSIDDETMFYALTDDYKIIKKKIFNQIINTALILIHK